MRSNCYSGILSVLFVVICCSAVPAQAQIISTLAGNDTAGYNGDGIPATAAQLQSPTGAVIDHSGNVYIADYNNFRVRKISTTGIISTIAGNGTNGHSGDGGPATAAQTHPMALAIDTAGNIYMSEYEDYYIRKVTPAGIISTVAGIGTYGFSGDGGPATAAHLYAPNGLAVDLAGNLYIADFANYRIRKVNPAGIISTFAGTGATGFGGDGGPATNAVLNEAVAVATDLAGNVYIADRENSRIRKVTPGGIISTLAGNGTLSFSGDGGPATAAVLNHPSGVAADAAGNLYIADEDNSRIRKIDPSGMISTVAGNGTTGFSGDGGAATLAQVNYASGVATDLPGNLFIVDQYNLRIRKVNTCIMPTAGTIHGINLYHVDTFCYNASLSDTSGAAGGAWSLTNTALGTISATGTVTPFALPMRDTARYVVNNACGADTAFYGFYVIWCPDAVNAVAGSSHFDVVVAPNPGSGHFILQFPSPSNESVTVSVTNILGQKVKELTLTAATPTEIQLDAPAGVYFLTAVKEGDKEMVRRKIVIE